MLTIPSKSTKAGWSSAILLLSCIIAKTAAKRTCDTSLFYPYCINVPDDSDGSTKLPTVLFLSGRGARGDKSQVETLSTYDGFGKLVNEYNSGNHDEAHTLAATKFISIVPVAPMYSSSFDPQYWQSELLDKVVEAVIAKYPVDTNRFSVAGYSMGAFGSWRYATYRPELIASIVPSGGNAEQNSITNSLGQTVSPIFDQLSKVKDIPVRAFVGSSDTTVPPAGAEQTQKKLESLGDTLAKLTILATDHSGLSVGPFDADTLNWMLQQKKSGSSSSSSDTTSGSSSSSDTKDTDTSSSGSGDSSSSADTSSSSSGTTKKKCTKRRNRQKRAAKAKRNLTLSAMLASRKASVEL